MKKNCKNGSQKYTIDAIKKLFCLNLRYKWRAFFDFWMPKFVCFQLEIIYVLDPVVMSNLAGSCINQHSCQTFTSKYSTLFHHWLCLSRVLNSTTSYGGISRKVGTTWPRTPYSRALSALNTSTTRTKS